MVYLHVMFSLSDVFFSRYTLHLSLSNPSLIFSQRCILLKVYFTCIPQNIYTIYILRCYLIHPVLISMSDVFFSRYTLHIFYPTRPYFSLRSLLYNYCYPTLSFSSYVLYCYILAYLYYSHCVFLYVSLNLS